MASPKKRLETNAPGDFFVDSTCIDCDTCRWMAPGTFDRAEGKARVHTQPTAPAARAEALRALISCPTGSIGKTERHDLRAAMATLPHPITPDVLHCGYHHADSFGAASYLLRRPEGNILIDSPRFARPLVQRLEELGGVATMFLTHQDDVADHASFARHFGCERFLHRDDVRPSTREVEHLLEGEDPISIARGLTVVPVPGHTRGSACLIADDTYLFAGDHVAWSDAAQRVHAFRGACWYDWDLQIESMERLAEHRFEWILPGHGRRCRFPAAEMPARMAECIAWMRSVA